MKNISSFFIPPIVITILLIVGAFYAFSEFKSLEEENIYSSLKALNESTVQGLESKVELLKKNGKLSVSYILKDQDLVKKIKSNDERANSLINLKLNELIKPALASFNFEGFFLINLNGINIGSTRQSNLNKTNLVILKDKNSWDTVLKTKEAVLTKIIPSDVRLRRNGNLVDKSDTAFIMAPLIDNNGEVFAVFMFRVNPDEIYKKILEKGKIGNSGKSFILTNEGRVMGKSRFLKGSINKSAHNPKLSSTLVADEITRKKSGSNIKGFIDHRGVRVAGAWTWSNQLKFGIASEVDFDEVMKPIIEFKKYIFLGVAIILPIVWVLFIKLINSYKLLALKN